MPTLPRRPSVPALALFALVALYIALCFGGHGISNDEEVQHVYGRLLLDYYASGLTDLAAFRYKNLYLYGGLFDLIAALAERLLPGTNVWDLRHLLTALFGLGGLLAVYGTGRRLAGEATALVAVGLLMLTGAWSGALFTHTKDIPFAACMAWATWATVRLLPALPRPPLSAVLQLGAAIGCAFGLRVGAVFAVMTLGLTVLTVSALSPGTLRARALHLLRSVVALLPALPVAVALMGLFWPWSVQAPGHLFTALTTFSHFTFDLYTVLNGTVMKIGEVPRHYLPLYLGARLPEPMLAGLAASAVAALTAGAHRRRTDWPHWLPVLLAAALPLALAIATRPSLYNGVRHFTFLLPPLALLAAAGLCAAGRRSRARPATFALFAALCLAGALVPAIDMTRLAPYHYVNYNRLAGGFAGAPGRWETDYWSDGVREATALLRARIDPEGVPAEPWQVAVCAESVQAQAWLPAERYQVTKDWVRADFFVSTTHMACDEVLRGEEIARVERMGVPLTVVKDRRAVPPELRRPLR